MGFSSELLSIYEFISKGGAALWAVFGLSILLWSLILERFVYLSISYQKHLDEAVNIWNSRTEHSSKTAHRIRECLLSQGKQRLFSSLPTIAALVKICPLLGLLGTVLGMMDCFDVIAEFGANSPRALAAGISQASISTMGGLVVGTVGLFFYTRLQRRAYKLEHSWAANLSINEKRKR